MSVTTSTVEDAVRTLREVSDQRAKMAVAAMQHGHNVVAATMLKDAAKLNDAVDVLTECFSLPPHFMG